MREPCTEDLASQIKKIKYKEMQKMRTILYRDILGMEDTRTYAYAIPT